MSDPLPYLVDLTLRLGAGVGELPADTRHRHAEYFLAAQQPDGGFAGREGPSDLYYTAFGIRALALLARLDGEPAERAAGFLRSRVGGNAHIIDFFSLVFAAQLIDSAAGVQVFDDADAWRPRVGDAIESLRAADGGYAKSPEGAASSTYYSFLAVLTRQLIDQPILDPTAMGDFLLSQRREDGGFVEIRPMRRSGTNPTAAAVGLLRVLDQLPDASPPRLSADVREDVTDFVLDLQTDEGGIRANTQIPVADLLSTFTG
ncbi:MAG: prenyltransferase/squalene oxidase repeat-containing protein, partial [Planctomycetota bacterium]